MMHYYTLRGHLDGRQLAAQNVRVYLNGVWVRQTVEEAGTHAKSWPCEGYDGDRNMGYVKKLKIGPDGWPAVDEKMNHIYETVYGKVELRQLVDLSSSRNRNGQSQFWPNIIPRKEYSKLDIWD